MRRGDIVTSLDAYRLSIFGTHMYMLYMPNRHHTRATSTFIEFILEQAGKTGRRGPDAMRQGFLSDDKPPAARRQ
ncbi:LysR family transcriptional regulator [Burkholderia sp. TJI49]|nr:LysR family transcriptional regulator [Burkholderia sp. TJI49]